MVISNRSKNAIAALLVLESASAKRPMNIVDIAARLGIASHTVEPILRYLRNQCWIKGLRGPTGGYYLTTHLEQISVADVIRAVENPGPSSVGVTQTPLNNTHAAVSNQLWGGLCLQIDKFLDQVSLANLRPMQSSHRMVR